MKPPRQSLAAWIVERWRWFWGLAPTGPDTASAKRGQLGEAAAAAFLVNQGWKILVRNWRLGREELDVVAWDGDVMVFVEVRTREAKALVPGYFSVTRRKKRAVLRAAKAYLRGLAPPPAHFRFDIVEVRVSDERAPVVRHYANVPLFPRYYHPARQR